MGRVHSIIHRLTSPAAAVSNLCRARDLFGQLRRQARNNQQNDQFVPHLSCNDYRVDGANFLPLDSASVAVKTGPGHLLLFGHPDR